MLQSAVNLVGQGSLNARGTDEALLLSVALATMLNTLAGRYREWSFARVVLQASGRRQIQRDLGINALFQQRSRYIGHEHGMYFLCDLVLDNSEAHQALRLPRAAVLTFERRKVWPLFCRADQAVLRTMEPPHDAPLDEMLWTE
jgi:hypothetical protein